MKYFPLLLVVLGFAAVLPAKEYHIDSVRVTAQIQPDGAVRIEEARTYSFDGAYTWANYTLEQERFSRLSDITLRDGSRTYSRSDAEQPGTFQVTTNRQEMNLKWFFQAADETRTFTLQYTVHGALRSGGAWTELTWPFLTDRWKRPTRHLLVKITLPSPVAEDSLYAWLRPTGTTADLTKQDGALRLTTSDIPASTALTGRVLFPTWVLDNPNIKQAATSLTPAAVRLQEEALQQQARSRQARDLLFNRFGRILLPVLLVLSPVIWLILWLSYRRSAAAPEAPKFLYRLPSDHRPAIVAWLLKRGSITGTHFLATLCDLSRRGYLVLHEEPALQGALRKNLPRFRIQPNEAPAEDADLQPWERSFYDFVISRMEDGIVYLHTLTDQRGPIRRWFPGWARSVETDARSRGFRDPRSVFGAWINGGIQIALAASSLLVIVWTGFIGLLPLLTAMIFAGCSPLILRRTNSAQRLFQQWKGLKNGMIRGDHTRFHQSEFDKLFTYSLVLGLRTSKRNVWLRSMEFDSAHFPWLYFADAPEHTGEKVVSAITALIDTGLQTVTLSTNGTQETAVSTG